MELRNSREEEKNKENKMERLSLSFQHHMKERQRHQFASKARPRLSSATNDDFEKKIVFFCEKMGRWRFSEVCFVFDEKRRRSN